MVGRGAGDDGKGRPGDHSGSGRPLLSAKRRATVWALQPRARGRQGDCGLLRLFDSIGGGDRVLLVPRCGLYGWASVGWWAWQV
jgi:hypothetical protein